MITCNNVVIRPIEKEELSLIQKWYNDDEVMYWASGSKPDMMVSMSYLEEVWYDEIYSDFSTRMMIETETGVPIGIIGYRNLNLQERRCRLSVFIGEKEYWGKGYGANAVKAFTRFLINRWNLNRVEADTWDGNVRAVKCYEKCGYKVEGRLRNAKYIDGQYRDEIILGILSQELQQDI